jgi:uncharacterized OsmC-like protein
VLTLAAVAAHKGMNPERIDVEIQRQTNARESDWETYFAVRLDLGQGLTPRERAIMLNSARHCEVHKLLTGVLRFDYHWADLV